MLKAAIQKFFLLVLIVICGCFFVVAFDFYPVHPFILKILIQTVVAFASDLPQSFLRVLAG